MKPYARLTAVVISFLVLQASAAPRESILGVQMDFLVPLALGIGMTYGSDIGAGAGFVLGLIQDVVFGAPLGLGAGLIGIVAFVMGTFTRTSRPKLPLASIASVGLTIVFVVAYGAVGNALDATAVSSARLWQIAVVSAGANAALVPFVVVAIGNAPAKGTTWR